MTNVTFSHIKMFDWFAFDINMTDEQQLSLYKHTYPEDTYISGGTQRIA